MAVYVGEATQAVLQTICTGVFLGRSVAIHAEPLIPAPPGSLGPAASPTHTDGCPCGRADIVTHDVG